MELLKPKVHSNVLNVVFSFKSTDGREKAPDPSERTEQREIDPSAYSLSSNAKVIDESFEETNEINPGQEGILTSLISMMNMFLLRN